MCGFGAPSLQRWELWLHVTLNLIWVNSRTGAFTSSSRKSSGEKGMFAGGSLSPVLLVFYMPWTASCQPGSCRVQCFCVGGSASACQTSLMLLSFQFLFWGEGGNAENEGERQAIRQGYNWRKVGRGKKKRYWYCRCFCNFLVVNRICLGAVGHSWPLLFLTLFFHDRCPGKLEMWLFLMDSSQFVTT